MLLIPLTDNEAVGLVKGGGIIGYIVNQVKVIGIQDVKDVEEAIGNVGQLYLVLNRQHNWKPAPGDIIQDALLYETFGIVQAVLEDKIIVKELAGLGMVDGEWPYGYVGPACKFDADVFIASMERRNYEFNREVGKVLKKPRKPMPGEEYYDFNGERHIWEGSPMDEQRHADSNCFPDIMVAGQAFDEVLKALKGFQDKILTD